MFLERDLVDMVLTIALEGITVSGKILKVKQPAQRKREVSWGKEPQGRNMSTETQKKGYIRAGDAVELAKTGQLGVQLGVLELASVLGLDITMDLIDITHIALGAVFTLDITDTLVHSRAAKSSHC